MLWTARLRSAIPNRSYVTVNEDKSGLGTFGKPAGDGPMANPGDGGPVPTALPYGEVFIQTKNCS